MVLPKVNIVARCMNIYYPSVHSAKYSNFFIFFNSIDINSYCNEQEEWINKEME